MCEFWAVGTGRGGCVAVFSGAFVEGWKGWGEEGGGRFI